LFPDISEKYDEPEESYLNHQNLDENPDLFNVPDNIYKELKETH